MPELASILDVYNDQRRTGEKMLLATVVDTKGSTYRKPGARMLVTSDGQRVGSLSGGCLEADVAKKGWWWTENGPVSRTYDTTVSEQGEVPFGLGCNGTVRILVERLDQAPARQMIEFLDQNRRKRETCVVATIVAAPDHLGVGCGEHMLVTELGASSTLADSRLQEVILQDVAAALADRCTRFVSYATNGETLDVFIEVVQPPVPLVIFGAGHDAVPLVRLAKELGFHVTVADARPSYAHAHRFPLADEVILTRPADLLAGVTLRADTIAVIMNHSYGVDRDLLGKLLPANLLYLGVLGPAARTGRMLEELKIVERPAHLHAPVGLDIGASTPETIALSIVAEIQAVLASRAGGMLRHSRGSIEQHFSDSKGTFHAV